MQTFTVVLLPTWLHPQTTQKSSSTQRSSLASLCRLPSWKMASEAQSCSTCHNMRSIVGKQSYTSKWKTIVGRLWAAFPTPRGLCKTHKIEDGQKLQQVTFWLSQAEGHTKTELKFEGLSRGQPPEPMKIPLRHCPLWLEARLGRKTQWNRGKYWISQPPGGPSKKFLYQNNAHENVHEDILTKISSSEKK